MATDLETYLQGDYLLHREEIREIETLIDEVARVFADFFDEGKGTWPYRLEDRMGIEESNEFSFSTNAMIAYASALAIGEIRESVLAPAIRRATAWRPQDEDVRARISKAVSGAVKSIEAASPHVQGGVADREERGRDKPRFPPYTDSTTFGWDDPFTLTWLVETIRAQRDPELANFQKQLAARASETVHYTLEHLNEPVLQIRAREVVPHTFPLLRVLQLGRLVDGIDFTRKDTVARTRVHLLDSIHRGLSESQLPDAAFDAADLVFALEGWLLTGPPGSFDFVLVERVFELLSQKQAQTSYWRPLRPFEATSTGLILLPQSVELANALLRICTNSDLLARSYFSAHLRLLQRYALWLRGRVFRGSTDDGRSFTGWESEHTNAQNQIHLWQTSQALIFLQHYAAMLRQHVARTLQQAAGLERRDPSAEEPDDDWETWLESEPISPSPHSPYRVYHEIEGDFVVPRLPAADGVDRPDPLFSMLLYGPPGTGKSTIARKVARKLGFELVTVTPSDFLTSGGEAVEARAKAIFHVLEEQRDVVVLFDEIDHLLLDRESALYRKQSDIFQLLTPGMLTKLARLADQRSVIFVIATNYFEQIDPAIRRVGRIDSRYLVLPPSMEQRKARMITSVDNFDALGPQLQDELATATLFFTYRELDELGEQLRRRSGGVKDEALVSAGIAAVSRSPALLSLHMYDDRLANKVGAREPPLEEFALVAYLELETNEGHFREAPPKPYAQAIKDALDRRLVPDDDVAAALKSAVDEHHPGFFA